MKVPPPLLLAFAAFPALVPPSGFTPNTHVGREWNGPDIWVRNTFTVPAGAVGKPVSAR